MSNKDNAVDPVAPEERRKIPGWLFVVAVGAVALVSFIAHALRNYYVKAYSDPLNWLEFASNLGSEFSTSRFSVGHAAFLWLVLKLTGPYYVFLANIPVLVLMVVLLALLAAYAARETETRAVAAFVGLVSLLFFLLFDPHMLVYLVNPYRDPMARVLLLSSSILFVAYLQGAGRRTFLVCLSGLLLGLACCMREPSVLIAGPLFFLGVVYRWRKKGIRFWIPVLLFGVFFLVGYSPCLIQTYCASGQMVMPSTYQAQSGKLLPGFGLFPESLTPQKMIDYYSRGGIAARAAFLLGLVFALKRRNIVMLFLIIPTVLVYGLLYSVYWTFVFRYFLIVTLFVMPVAAFGTCKLVETVLRPIKKPRATIAGLVVVVLVLVGQVVSVYNVDGDTGRLFQIPDAKKLARDIDSMVPGESTIICPRHLCEILSWFSHADSYPAHALLEPGFLADTNVCVQIDKWLDAGHPAFYMDVPRDRFGERNRALIERYFNIDLVGEYQTRDYNLHAIQGDGSMVLSRIVRQSGNTAEHVLSLPSGGSAILRVNTGGLWRPDVDRKYAKLSLSGTILDEHPVNGANYYYLASGTFSGTCKLVLESDAPVKSDLEPLLVSPDERILVDLGIFSRVLHSWTLSESIRNRPSRILSMRSLCGRDSITLPAPWPLDRTVNVEFQVRAYGKAGGEPVPFAVYHDGVRIASVSVERNYYDFTSVVVPVRDRRESGPLVLDLVTGNDEGDPAYSLEFDCVNLFATPMQSLAIDIGKITDGPFIVSGFYDRESSGIGRALRWTAKEAVVRLYDWPSSADLKLVMNYWQQCRPATAPADDIRLFFNDRALDTTFVPPGEGEQIASLEALLPVETISSNDNYLKILCEPWVPRECVAGSEDQRELGIFVDAIIVKPVD